MNKLILSFSGPTSAKKFVQKVKQLPYVTYATDYCRGNSHSDVMICGDFDEERIEFIKSLKRY